MKLLELQNGQATLLLDPDDCRLLHESCSIAAREDLSSSQREQDLIVVRAMGTAFKACHIATVLQDNAIPTRGGSYG